jgi:hypothetical protein
MNINSSCDEIKALREEISERDLGPLRGVPRKSGSPLHAVRELLRRISLREFGSEA